MKCRIVAAIALAAWAAVPAFAEPVIYSNLTPIAWVGVQSQSGMAGGPGIEAADDFIVASRATVGHASFIGLLTDGATAADIQAVVTRFYRTYPFDSDMTRTPQVATRVNTPSDAAFASRSSLLGDMTVAVTTLEQDVETVFSVGTPSIQLLQPTGGDFRVRGVEVRIDLTYSNGLELDPDHYFFAPQLTLDQGGFYWLTAPRPISAIDGTPILPDLQNVVRGDAISPDWLHVGTDIIADPIVTRFNFAFALEGADPAASVPEPASAALVFLGLGAAGLSRGRRRPT